MKKALLLLVVFAGVSLPAAACVTCNRALQEAIFNSTFYPNLATMLSAFFVLAGIVAALSWMGDRRHRKYQASGENATVPSPVPLFTAAVILGIGLGGFIDGIVLHQILQWHNMLSAKVPPDTVLAKGVNMFWDGVFHFFTLCVTLLGVVRLWRTGQRTDAVKSAPLLGGGLLIGWGIFNGVEGIIDHQILQLHNVREQTAHVQGWNVGFLFFSILLVGAGSALCRSRRTPKGA